MFTQNLINMAQCSILVEELMPDFVLRRMKLDRKLYICGHSLCPKGGCKGKSLPTSMKLVFEDLKKISLQNEKEKNIDNKADKKQRIGSSVHTQTVILNCGKIL